MAKGAVSKANATNQKKKKKGMGPFSILLILIALAIMAYSGYRLYDIFSGYAKANNEYDELAEDFTSGSAADIEEQDWNSAEAIAAEETVPPPIDVDWDSLKAINKDVVGWLYMEAQPTISYPICHGEDNEFYLHHTFRKEAVFAGSIFVEAKNEGNFSDRNTIVYGHNMKNQSMFGLLKYYKTEETYKKSPYFWILTPEGNYRYKIFAAFDSPQDGEVYTIFKSPGDDFYEWELRMQNASAINTGVKVLPEDFVVTLSTCTSNSTVRCVVLGRLVSTDKPQVDLEALEKQVAEAKKREEEEKKAAEEAAKAASEAEAAAAAESEAAEEG